MAISVAARKAKGRLFQQYCRNILRKIGEKHGLVDDDIHSIGMGQNGCDIVLTPAAKQIFPFFIECKKQESLNIWTTFVEHFAKYKDVVGLKLLLHTKNHGIPLATLRLEDLFNLIEENLDLKRNNVKD